MIESEQDSTRSGLLVVSIALLMLAVLCTPINAYAGEFSDFFEGSEETFVAFPTYAAMQEDGSLIVPIRIWSFEPEQDSIKRAILIELFEEALDIEDPEKEDLFEARIRPFLYDNERGKEFFALIDGKRYRLGESSANGHVATTLELPVEAAMHAVIASPGEQNLEIVIGTESTTRELVVPVIGRRGMSVISDIDDTIKDSNVLDDQELLRRTFMEPFRSIEGMAAAYRGMEESLDASFHYLSASPWQLYPFFARWMERANFPDGTFHLRQLRPSRPKSVKRFTGSSRAYKISELEQLLTHMPERDFILIGDSGEADPEVYGEIARRHPDRVARILIRRVEGAENGIERFKRAFEGVPTASWNVFEDPSTIDPTN